TIKFIKLRRVKFSMIKKAAILVSIVALVVISFAPLALSVSQAPSGAIFKENIGESSSQSLNWAGYVIPSSDFSVNDVYGSWIIPTVNTGGNSYVAFWVGIDGYNDSTVEQTGILAEPSGHGPHSSTIYKVWYEFYPASPVYAAFTASAGDNVNATVSYNPTTGNFTTSITVYSTSGKVVGTLTHTQKVKGALDDSAEWIVEAPSSTGSILPLANFGTVYFGKDYTGFSGTNYATIGGSTRPISLFSYVSITMVSTSGTPMATPSTLSPDGTSFSVTYDQTVSSLGHSH
ncbi:MAG: G1 family glutamic endopeptidase, partial [Conexivisphaerales archaeon]